MLAGARLPVGSGPTAAGAREHDLTAPSDHEQLLQSQQRAAALMAERSERDDDLAQAKADEADALEQLRGLMQDAWRGLVAEPAKAVLATAQDNAQEALDDVTASIRARALADGACGVCERPLDAPAIARLQESVATVTADPAEVLSNVASTLEQATTLGRFANADRSAEIERLWKQLERASVEQTSARDRIKDINELLSDANPDEIRKSRTQYDKVIAQIHDHEVAIEKTEEEINTLDGRIVDLKKQIQEAGDEGEATSSANARAETLRAATEVFDGAIERY
jgi:chromosome segregation ATPase